MLVEKLMLHFTEKPAILHHLFLKGTNILECVKFPSLHCCYFKQWT